MLKKVLKQLSANASWYPLDILAQRQYPIQRFGFLWCFFVLVLFRCFVFVLNYWNLSICFPAFNTKTSQNQFCIRYASKQQTEQRHRLNQLKHSTVSCTLLTGSAGKHFRYLTLSCPSNCCHALLRNQNRATHSPVKRCISKQSVISLPRLSYRVSLQN